MPFNFYFAGTQCQESTDLLRELNCNILKSYVNDRKEIKKWFQYKDEGWTGKLMIDNGEFTFHRHGGTLDIDEYINWLNDNDDHIDYAIALDSIPGKWGQKKTLEDVLKAPEKTWENYCYMYSRVKHPKKLLPVFHQGENFKWLENMLESGKPDYICISGNKELTNRQREEWYAKCFAIIDRINPNIKAHCLGSATMQNAVKYPFTSMDATSWIMTGANGSILTEFGVVNVGNKSTLLPTEMEVVEKYISKYGFTLDQIREDYKARMIINIHYINDTVKDTHFNGVKIRKRRLF